METTQIRRQTLPAEYDVEDDDALYTTRMPSSARRYRPTPPAQQPDAGSATQKGTLIQRRPCAGGDGPEVAAVSYCRDTCRHGHYDRPGNEF